MNEYKNDTGYELEWDSEIEQEGQEFILLPDGTYPFKVTGFERRQYDGSSKIPPCKMALVHLAIDGGALGTAYIDERLYLHSTMEWKLTEFFTAIGLRKKGERVAMNWSAVPGATGMCEVNVNKYTTKDGQERTNNRIGKFLPWDNAAIQAPQPAQQSWTAPPAQTQQATAPQWQQNPQSAADQQQQTMDGFQQRGRMGDYQIGKF